MSGFRFTGDLVPFLRPFDWLSPTLTTFRERPLPSRYTTIASPTFDLFGTSRVGEMQFAEVAGTLGAIEVLHTQVPQGRFRMYLSMMYGHDDTGVSHKLSAIRVVNSLGGFPQAPFRDRVGTLAFDDGEFLAVRNIMVPPDGFIGVGAFGLPAGVRIIIRVLWVEMPVGESFQLV